MLATTMIRRNMLRSAGQITMSVVATLIASSLYSAFWPPARPATPVPAPTLTSGGKFDMRIAGAGVIPAVAPQRPLLSIVNWAITPPYPASTVPDIAWSADGDAVVLPAVDRSAAPAPKPPRHVPKPPPVTVAEAPIPTPAPASREERHALSPIAMAAAMPHAAWSLATSAAGTLVSFGGSAVSAGGAILGRLVP